MEASRKSELAKRLSEGFGRRDRSPQCAVTWDKLRAGRVASRLPDIIKRHPVELVALLRTTKGLTTEVISRLARNAQGGESFEKCR